MMYCVGNGTKILNIFNPNGEGVMMSYQANPSAGFRADQRAQRGELEAVLTGESTAAKVNQPIAAGNETTT